MMADHQPTAEGTALHQETLDDYVLIRTDQVDRDDRLRAVDPVWGEALGALMAKDGQQTPIQVCRLPGRERWTLVVGAHRHFGAERHGIAYLKAEIVSADRESRRLREIVENLHRRDLDPLDRAAFLAELVALKRARAGLDTVANRDARVSKRLRAPGNDFQVNDVSKKALNVEASATLETISNVYGWSDEVGEQLGLTGRTIRNDLLLYRRLAPSLVARLRAARHPVLANATQLRGIAKLEPRAQNEVVDALVGDNGWEPCRTVAEAVKRTQPAKVTSTGSTKWRSTILSTLKRMSRTDRVALFQDPDFHGLIPAEARILLAPILRDGAGEAHAQTDDLPSHGDRQEAGVDRHGRATGSGGTDADRERHHSLDASGGSSSDGLALVGRSPIPGGASEDANLADHDAIAVEIDQLLAAERDPDWIANEMVRRHGGRVRFANGTYELKVAKISATCTAGGYGLLRAWKHAAERKAAA